MFEKYYQKIFNEFGVKYGRRMDVTIADWLNKVRRKHKHDIINVKFLPIKSTIVVIVEILKSQ